MQIRTTLAARQGGLSRDEEVFHGHVQVAVVPKVPGFGQVCHALPGSFAPPEANGVSSTIAAAYSSPVWTRG